MCLGGGEAVLRLPRGTAANGHYPAPPSSPPGTRTLAWDKDISNVSRRKSATVNGRLDLKTQLPRLSKASFNAFTCSSSLIMAGQQQESRSLWVFGYGSLCWMPGFQFGASSVGYIRNYVRRFWQGNTTHRGTASKVSFDVL